MNEDEAKTKACCGGVDCGKWAPPTKDQLQFGIPSQRFCIGSACMAWRYDENSYGQNIVKGFCGLAGQP